MPALLDTSMARRSQLLESWHNRKSQSYTMQITNEELACLPLEMRAMLTGRPIAASFLINYRLRYNFSKCNSRNLYSSQSSGLGRDECCGSMLYMSANRPDVIMSFITEESRSFNFRKHRRKDYKQKLRNNMLLA